MKMKPMRRLNIHSILLALCLLSGMTLGAQTRNRAYEEYIEKYREVAIAAMIRLHIPPSITLAQDLLSPVPEEVNWPGSQITISALSVEAPGKGGQCVITMMLRANVSVPTGMPANLTGIIPSF